MSDRFFPDDTPNPNRFPQQAPPSAPQPGDYPQAPAPVSTSSTAGGSGWGTLGTVLGTLFFLLVIGLRLFRILNRMNGNN